MTPSEEPEREQELLESCWAARSRLNGALHHCLPCPTTHFPFEWI